MNPFPRSSLLLRFFFPKVLEYIMEITLNHILWPNNMCLCQSLSAANSGFYADMNLFQFLFPALISYCKIIGSFSATLASAFLKKICPKEMGVFHQIQHVVQLIFVTFFLHVIHKQQVKLSTILKGPTENNPSPLDHFLFEGMFLLGALL